MSATRRCRVLHRLSAGIISAPSNFVNSPVNRALTYRISCSMSAAARRRCSPGISSKWRLRIRWIRRVKSGAIDSHKSPLGA
jgi:hypothetical protein